MHQLRPYQTKAIDDIRESFTKRKKVLLVAPTGSGKTVVAADIIRKVIENGKKCVFVAHRRELIMQCSNKLFNFGVRHGVIMADKAATPDADVQVVSIQTYTARKDNFDFDRPDADLIIFDEAHRSASFTFQKMIEEYPEAHVIGLTATPCRADGKGLGDIYQGLIECSNIKDLTEEGYLVPSRIYAPTMPDLKGLKVLAGDYEKGRLDKRMNTPKLIGDIVNHWIMYGQDRPTVAFATSINHSKKIAKMFNDSGIPAGHIDGKMPEIERERQLAMIKDGRIKVLANCQVLTEGWDEPKISCVILARPTKSYGLYLQMVGRSLRPDDGKKDTLIIDHSGAVYEHGFPDEPPQWTLDVTTNVSKERKEPQPIEKQPFTCVQCDFVYKPTADSPECPNCGCKPTKKDTELLIAQGRLVELKKKKNEPTVADKETFYAGLLFYARQRGYLDGWASYLFKNKFKHFPNFKKNILPVRPTKDVEGYIKHHNIKRHKSKIKIQNMIGGNNERST